MDHGPILLLPRVPPSAVSSIITCHGWFFYSSVPLHLLNSFRPCTHIKRIYTHHKHNKNLTSMKEVACLRHVGYRDSDLGGTCDDRWIHGGALEFKWDQKNLILPLWFSFFPSVKIMLKTTLHQFFFFHWMYPNRQTSTPCYALSTVLAPRQLQARQQQRAPLWLPMRQPRQIRLARPRKRSRESSYLSGVAWSM